MAEVGLIQLIAEDAASLTYQLNPHQLQFKHWQKVLLNHNGQLLQAQVLRTSPRKIQIKYWNPDGTERLKWVIPSYREQYTFVGARQAEPAGRIVQ
jgi:hypothetical protein